jgi:hypothetical protein
MKRLSSLVPFRLREWIPRYRDESSSGLRWCVAVGTAGREPELSGTCSGVMIRDSCLRYIVYVTL